MKSSEVQVGEHYTAKVSNRIVVVKLLSITNGVYATSLLTGREVRFRTAGKLRRHVPQDRLDRTIDTYHKSEKRIDFDNL